MATFELDRDDRALAEQGDGRRISQESILTIKVYDQCRQQECLTPNILGPARAYNTTSVCGRTIKEGEVITPPSDAATVSIDKLRLKKIIIVDKDPSPFRPGFWDIDLKYVFVYTLTFRDGRGDVICSIRANNIFNKNTTLFGSIGSDIVIGTDIMNNDSDTMDADPFVFCEGKAVALSAELKYCRCRRKECCEDEFASLQNNDFGAAEVLVTIGLFSIIDLCRIVNLMVDSRGFSVPRECDETHPLNPCEFFDNLEFPMNIFAPPERADLALDDGGSCKGKGCKKEDKDSDHDRDKDKDRDWDRERGRDRY